MTPVAVITATTLMAARREMPVAVAASATTT
jgi:hypothetical protein